MLDEEEPACRPAVVTGSRGQGRRRLPRDLPRRRGTCEFPQSGERFEGVENFQDMAQAVPSRRSSSTFDGSRTGTTWWSLRT